MPTAWLTKGLSAQQHRIIRVHLALIPAYVWLLYVWPVLFAQLPVRSTADQPHLVRDFLHFYVVGTITRAHDAHALYDINAMAAVTEGVLPGVPKNIFPPVYGPQVGLLFAPFSEFDYVSALYVWLALTLVGTGACVYVVWRSSEVRRRFPWPVAVFALGMPGLHFTLSFGQISVLGLACFTGLWLALQSGRPFAAGLAVGALAYKPQLGLVVACVFILRREWRVVAGAVLAIAAQFLAAWAYWGTSIFEGYARAIPRYLSLFGAMEPDAQLAYSVRALLVGLHLDQWAVAASVSLSVVVIGLWVAAWRQEVPVDLRYAGLVFATLLVDPHLYGYDLLLAAPALLLAGDRAWRRRDHLGLLCMTSVYCAPILTLVLPGPSVLTPLALVAATGWTLGQSFLKIPVKTPQ